jgi:ferrochelatase
MTLGSPRAPEAKAVGEFLREFLMDPYVIDRPSWQRWLLVNALIVPARARRVANLYHKIWAPSGSPLLAITESFARKVGGRLGAGYDVRWCSRYGAPALADALRGCPAEEVFIVPLYPQYAESSTRTAIEHVLRGLPDGVRQVHALKDFFAASEFIESQARQIESACADFRPDRLILSYHGLPKHHLTKIHQGCFSTAECCARVGESNRYCYRAQTFATSEALVRRLSLARERIHIAYQSRLGRRPWIEPFTDELVTRLAREGARRVLVSCPSFVADCLETLEEVSFRLRDQFRAAGGEELRLVPAVNDEDHWIENFCAMVGRRELFSKEVRV